MESHPSIQSPFVLSRVAPGVSKMFLRKGEHSMLRRERDEIWRLDSQILRLLGVQRWMWVAYLYTKVMVTYYWNKNLAVSCLMMILCAIFKLQT